MLSPSPQHNYVSANSPVPATVAAPPKPGFSARRLRRRPSGYKTNRLAQAKFESADWAPQNVADVKQILRGLPSYQRVICALVAAEMVLPVWEAWAGYDFGASAPRKAIRAVWDWLRIDATRDDVQVAREFCAHAIAKTQNNYSVRPVSHLAAESAARAAFHACHHAVSHGSALEPGTAGILAAIDARAYALPRNSDWRRQAAITRRAALAEWWACCRERLNDAPPPRMQSA